MDVLTPFIASGETTKAVEPSQCPFHHASKPPHSVADIPTAAGDGAPAALGAAAAIPSRMSRCKAWALDIRWKAMLAADGQHGPATWRYRDLMKCTLPQLDEHWSMSQELLSGRGQRGSTFMAREKVAAPVVVAHCEPVR